MGELWMKGFPDATDSDAVGREFYRRLETLCTDLLELLNFDEEVEDATGTSVLPTPDHKKVTEALADLLQVKDSFAPK